MATLRSVRRILSCSPSSLVLLLLTLGTVCLLVQWSLLDSSQDPSGLDLAQGNRHIHSHPVMQFTEEFLKRYDYDYLKCKRLANEVTSLEDLKRVTNSYVSTLADLEEREHIQLEELEELQASAQKLADEVNRLTAKSLSLKHRLLRQVLEASELETRLLTAQQRLDDLVQEKNGLVTSAAMESALQPTMPTVAVEHGFQPSKAITCSIDTGFNYKKQCSHSPSAKLRVHLLDMSVDLFDRYGLRSTSQEVQRSVEFVTDPSDACLIAVSLDVSVANKELAGRLHQLYTTHSDLNLMLVLPSPGNTSPNATTNSVALTSLKQHSLQWPSLHRKLTQSVICSLEQPTAHNDLWVPFSLFSDVGYLSRIQSLTSSMPIVDYLHGRDHLLSFHAPPFYRFPGRDLTARLAADRRFDINLECAMEDCGSLAQRLERLRRAQFTLIVQPVGGDATWSVDSTHRLVEALSCGTVPVLVGVSSKPPLHGLVAWADVAVQIPFNQLHQLGLILSELDRGQIVTRQVRGYNVYRAYLVSNSAMTRTLFAAVQYRIGLAIAPLTPYTDAKTISFSVGSNKIFQRSGRSNHKPTEHKKRANNADPEYELDEETYFDAGQENDDEIEYLGEINQKPLASDSFHNNFTRDTHASWNKYYHPFDSFPSTPFDSRPSVQDSLFRVADQFSVYLNSTSDDEDQVRLAEYLELTNASLGGSHGQFFHHMLGGNYQEEQFTIVVLSYKREQLLMDALEGYLKTPYLHSVLVVWNAVDAEPSVEFQQRFHLYVASDRLRVLRSRVNSLNNRFLPYDAIQTDAVLSLDDDVLLRPDEIQFGFRVWRENRERIVGFPARHHTWDLKQRAFTYQSYKTCEYSMVLTGAAFYHRFYNFYYSQVMTGSIRAKVDELNNCEDIAFNMMVAHLTRRPPLKASDKWSFACPSCSTDASDDSASISLRPEHYENRSRCIRFFMTIYGYNPLLYSQFRADSVLFKTQMPGDSQKCYKFV